MRWILALPALILFVALPEIFSPTGSVEGVISDESAPVMAAQIAARNTMTGIVYRTVSGRAGDYTLQHMRKGQYTLWVQAKGYNPVEVARVFVEAGRTTRRDVKLRRISPRSTLEGALSR